MILIKKLYNSLSNQTINLMYSAEQFNLLWKLQWEYEWKEAKKKKLFVSKKKGLRHQINLQTIVDNQNLSTKEKKSNSSKKDFSFGYDRGFTKNILMLKLENKMKINKKKIK